ncbi:1-acyl-sn-glycerol-3-phosphate acyltransferase beta [Rhizoclosmatium sp. JEL0117]|nr:1-acyl-sn-glycerol-3-phosphate acyltransferase beta [Rhizoclosmatium sp. JEL0117]
MSGSFLGASVVGAASASLRVLVGLDRRGANDDAAKALEQLLRFSFGQVLDVQIEGRDFLGPKSDRPAVFVCNHQNILDILLLAHVFPRHCCIMAKDAFFYVPFMGQFLYLADNIFIDRANAKSAAKTMQFVAAEMKRKKVGIFMYPEGTRSYQSDNSLLPFKQGAFRLAIEGQVPIDKSTSSYSNNRKNSSRCLQLVE